MVTTPEGRSIGEHDWHSSDYVDWWIHRDLGRDANRRQQLRAMLSHAAIAACYRGVAQTLKPGGAFLDYDLFFDEIGGVEHHIELLREAGFARVECLWRQAPLATLKAVKSGG